MSLTSRIVGFLDVEVEQIQPNALPAWHENEAKRF